MLTKVLLTLPLVILLCSSKKVTEEGYTARWGERKPPIEPRAPKVYEINLDLPYQERWKEVILDFKEHLDEFRKVILLKYLPTSWMDFISYPLAERYSKEYAEELKAIADLSDVPFTEIFFLNFIYELGAMCTSVVVNDSNDNIILARSLDFGLSSYVGQLVFHGKYYKGGKLLYEAIDVAGYLGLITGTKPQAYALSVNQYLLESNWYFMRHLKLAFSYLQQIYKGKLPPPYIIRKAFENTKDYESFVDVLKNTDTISRIYYIVAGVKKGQGAVIPKFEKRVDNFEVLDPDNGEWFLAQTNYERHLPDPEKDNRRTAATERLEKIGKREINPDRVFYNLMTLYPTFNAHSIHTTLMIPKNDYFNTTLWY